MGRKKGRQNAKEKAIRSPLFKVISQIKFFMIVIVVWPTMNNNIKVEFEMFNEKGSFSIWKVRVEDLLVQNYLYSVLKDRPEGMMDKQWILLEKRVCAAIRGCLANSALYSMLEEKTPKGLWSKLHTMYMKKNMSNKLMLKK